VPETRKNAADAAASPPAQAPELTITRTFAAPRDLVYKLFTEPEHLMHWMGPYGYTPMHFTQDARVGGAWRGMLRPDDGGKDLWQGGVFREITPPKRVSYTFAWDEDDYGKPGNVMLVTLDFEDIGGKTRLNFHQSGFTTAGQRDGHNGGWSSSFDRFEEYLATVTTTTKQ
jgi:uncharacterized protein YndB with AHSA1/START domain